MSVDLNLGDDQRQVLDAVQSLLDDQFPLSRLREQPAPDDLSAFVDFGGFALSLPEEVDGTGFSVVEEALVHVRFGRHLVSPGSLAAPLAAQICAHHGQIGRGQQIATGTARVCAGLARTRDVLLFDAEGADYALVWDRGELRLATLEGQSLGTLPSIGHDRPVATAAIPAADMLAAAPARILLLADLLVSAQLLGIAEGALALALEYARLREQFGRPIGAFQAIKHQLADIAIKAEMVSAQLDMAAIALRDGSPHAAFQVAALRRLAGKAALASTRRAIQVHGGIGFSAEADAHHFLKRAHLLSQLGGFDDMLAVAAPLTPIERT
jgi:alkylation response protein AidB-like acyl-CoA dehydrogenase